MRVALVVERFEPAGGGVEHAVWNIANALAEAGDEVHVVARSASASDTVQIHTVPVPAFWQPLRVLGFSHRAGRATRGRGFDVVHGFSRTLHQDVYHAGGGSHADYMQRVYGSRGARARRLSPRHAVLLGLERRIFSDPCQLVQCVSRAGMREIARRFGVPESRLVVAPYGVDAQRFHPERNAAAGGALRAELGACDETVWLLAGSGWRRKGLDTALRALSLAEDRRALLFVAGRDDPAGWTDLARQLGVADRVRFLGRRPDLEVVYAASDGLLLPTRYDAFGLVCLEAAASGKPVVTSAAAGASELVARAGQVIESPEDAPGFAAAISRLSDPTLRDRLGAEGRRIALAHGWHAHAEALRAIYARVRP